MIIIGINGDEWYEWLGMTWNDDGEFTLILRMIINYMVKGDDGVIMEWLWWVQSDFLEWLWWIIVIWWFNKDYGQWRVI